MADVAAVPGHADRVRADDMDDRGGLDKIVSGLQVESPLPMIRTRDGSRRGDPQAAVRHASGVAVASAEPIRPDRLLTVDRWNLRDGSTWISAGSLPRTPRRVEPSARGPADGLNKAGQQGTWRPARASPRDRAAPGMTDTTAHTHRARPTGLVGFSTAWPERHRRHPACRHRPDRRGIGRIHRLGTLAGLRSDPFAEAGRVPGPNCRTHGPGPHGRPPASDSAGGS